MKAVASRRCKVENIESDGNLGYANPICRLTRKAVATSTVISFLTIIIRFSFELYITSGHNFQTIHVPIRGLVFH